ncbi:MAG: DUF1674 domain-containing protein [Geminicoccaceae bacterium]|nr:DUF1674 domain-containing protein [Geminicoccaceae bacterium]
MSERTAKDRASRDRPARDPRNNGTAPAVRDEMTTPQPPGERGGPRGPEPTRFGDWEKGGRCFDF